MSPTEQIDTIDLEQHPNAIKMRNNAFNIYYIVFVTLTIVLSISNCGFLTLVRGQLSIQSQLSLKPQPAQVIPVSSQQPIRGVRTADVFQNGDGYNIFVTNTCERESMKVNIRTGKPFYGVIHTRNQRNKPMCTIEGNGDTDYNLEINHVLQPTDPLYCGVTRSQKKSPEDKENLSVIVAFRIHRNIELSDDKFFLLNCTNRCRRPDCSRPNRGLAELQNDPSDSVTGGNSEVANFPPVTSNNNNFDDRNASSDPDARNSTTSD